MYRITGFSPAGAAKEAAPGIDMCEEMKTKAGQTAGRSFCHVLPPDDSALDTRPPLVIIAGPTAVGKSEAAVELALRIHGSIISADSMQVYRGMDIGTAKIRPDQRKGIPHYLIDLIDPRESWSVVQFQKEARKALAEIYRENRIPILCGGTGFYIQALLYDIDFTAMQEDLPLRESLLALYRQAGPEALHERLRAVDPVSAEVIHPNNVKRVIRALEYYAACGKPISAHNEAEKSRPAAFRSASFVLWMERETLYRRIDDRVDRMFEAGLVDEVRQLKEKGLRETDVSMQGLGYRQVLAALNGTISMEEARARIKQETRHFSKRQITWFRREPQFQWINRSDYPDTAALAEDLDIRVNAIFGQMNLPCRKE